jgi:hypothetical protein
MLMESLWRFISITSRLENRNRLLPIAPIYPPTKMNYEIAVRRLLSPMARTFVGDVAVAVIELAAFAEVVRNVLVAEPTLFRAFGLRRRPRGILVGVERESHRLNLQERKKQAPHRA